MSVLHSAIVYPLVSHVCQSPSSYVLLVSHVCQRCPLYSSPSMGRLELRWRISHASYTYISAAIEVHAGQMHMWQGAAFEYR